MLRCDQFLALWLLGLLSSSILGLFIHESGDYEIPTNPFCSSNSPPEMTDVNEQVTFSSGALDATSRALPLLHILEKPPPHFLKTLVPARHILPQFIAGNGVGLEGVGTALRTGLTAFLTRVLISLRCWCVLGYCISFRSWSSR